MVISTCHYLCLALHVIKTVRTVKVQNFPNLLQLTHIEVEDWREGLCRHFWKHARPGSRNMIDYELSLLFKQWPHYSGSPDYPICVDTWNISGRDQYTAVLFSNSHTYVVTAAQIEKYIELRKDLFNFIKTVVELVESEHPR